jgi:hypothetical protein
MPVVGINPHLPGTNISTNCKEEKISSVSKRTSVVLLRVSPEGEF